jgi:hypothetical protein
MRRRAGRHGIRRRTMTSILEMPARPRGIHRGGEQENGDQKRMEAATHEAPGGRVKKRENPGPPKHGLRRSGSQSPAISRATTSDACRGLGGLGRLKREPGCATAERRLGKAAEAMEGSAAVKQRSERRPEGRQARRGHGWPGGRKTSYSPCSCRSSGRDSRRHFGT